MKKRNLTGLMIAVFLVSVIFSGNNAFAARRAVVVTEVVPALPAPMGPKKIVAVADFENKAGKWSSWELGSGFSEMLVTSLIASERFIVVERQEIGRVMAEQDFGMSGRTAGGNSAAIGKILKAQLLIQGAVTEFDPAVEGSSGGVGIKGFAIGGQTGTAHVAVTIRLYDTTTGQVIDSQRCEGHAKSGGMSVSYAEPRFAIGGSHFSKTPLGEATQMAIDKAVFFISSRMQNVPWEGKVIKTDEAGGVFINCGQRNGIVAGDSFNVYAPGEELIDPDTGESLGSDMTLKGQVQIMSPADVKEKFSTARPISGGGFDKDDIVKYIFR